MAEYSKIMQGEFTSTGVAKFVQLPALPTSFEIVNKTAYTSDTINLVKEAFSYQNENAGTAYILFNGAGTTVANADTITVGGFTWITADSPQFGAVVSASGGNSVDKDADFMAVNITAHGFLTGDVVWLYGTTGMLQIAGMPFTVTKVNDNQFTIPIDTSEYTFAADATAVSAKKFLYPDLYVPYLVMPVGITQAAQAVVTTNVNHGFEIGQRVKFSIPSQWGMVELNDLEATVVSVGNIDNAQSYTAATSGTYNAFQIDLNTTTFTDFDFPASAVVAAGIQFPQVYSVGDVNFGYVYNGPDPINRVLGAFRANTRYGILVGLGGTQVMHAEGDVVHWRAEVPDMYKEE